MGLLTAGLGFGKFSERKWWSAHTNSLFQAHSGRGRSHSFQTTIAFSLVCKFSLSSSPHGNIASTDVLSVAYYS